MVAKAKNIWEIDEPSFLKVIKPDSLLNAKDLADIFKLSKTGVEKRILDGEIPPPDYLTITGHDLHGNNTYANKRFWKAKTVRLLFKQLKEKQNGI